MLNQASSSDEKIYLWKIFFDDLHQKPRKFKGIISSDFLVSSKDRDLIRVAFHKTGLVAHTGI